MKLDDALAVLFVRIENYVNSKCQPYEEVDLLIALSQAKAAYWRERLARG